MFITFEGLDFSGKTTQATLLVQRLEQNGHNVVFLREPGGTNISERIRSILLDQNHASMDQVTELLLFSASRAQLVSEVILPALKKGEVVICDRFSDSTVAYQGWGRGLNIDALKSINKVATYGLLPDLTFLIDLRLEDVWTRMKHVGAAKDRLERSGQKFYERVRDGYLDAANVEPGRFVVLDGLRSVEQIHEQVWKVTVDRTTSTQQQD